jgi:hypothetical protein
MKYRNWIGATMIALWTLSPIAMGAGDGYTLEDLELDSSSDLVDLCTIEAGHEHYETALAFCYGFFEGAIHYDDVISRTPAHVDLVCSPPGTTRSQAVEVFVTYMQANPNYGSDAPIDGIFRALIDQWPCAE